MKLTIALVAINVIVFFLSLTNLDYYITNYGFSIKGLLAGNAYVLITSMFLHAGLMHLASNMLFLFFLGVAVESKMKSWQYLVAYFGAGVVGNLIMFVPIFGYGPDMIAVGASAAISGLIGLGTFVCPGKFVFFGSIIPVPFVLAGAIYFISTVSLLFVESNIAYPGHFGGLAVGALFGLAWGEDRVKRLLIFIAVVAFILALPTIIGVIFRFLT
jgi:rhomboid protease GluP